MGTLLNATLADIINEDERHVVDILTRRLSDDWLIVANYMMTEIGQEHETDTIVIHPRHGIGIVEVKGGRINLENGQWVHNGQRADPEHQARSNANTLARQLRPIVNDQYLKVGWSICLPQVTEIRGQIPSSIGREQLITANDFNDVQHAIEEVFANLYYRPVLHDDVMQKLIDYLCPTADFSYDPQALASSARHQLQVICETQVQALASLDVNHRVVVSGRAGTGKTYLATKWTTSGLMRDDDEAPKRVLLTCYNDPLAERLQTQFQHLLSVDDEEDEFAPTLKVGSFLRVIRDLDGMPEPPFEEKNDNEYWNVQLPAHLLQHWAAVTERFDRIIVDEAQDFAPAWLGMLESLLDPRGENKFFLLIDERQQLLDRGFVEPTISAGWTKATLQSNVRNSREIAQFARRFLDGAEAQPALPTSEFIVEHRANSYAALASEVRTALHALRQQGLAERDILVVCSDGATRDALRQDLGLRPVTDHVGIGCELSHRAKGLEAPAVVVAIGEQGMRDNNFYVAVTRAVNQLHIVGPSSFVDRYFAPAGSHQ